MANRVLPLKPDLAELRLEAEARFRDPSRAHGSIEDARHALANEFEVADWQRLELACEMVNAIWRDDADAVREMIAAQPRLLHENASGIEKSSWGPPMSYAANLGSGNVIAALHDLGATDHQHAFDRACLQGRLDTARQLHAMGARPADDATMGPAETQNGAGMEFVLGLGAGIQDADGDRMAPVAMVLETYCRNPAGKHQCLELFAQHGIELPDTPTMAVHRGRIDLLETHLRRDPGLCLRTFPHEQIYPSELGCHADHALALHGTPLAGGTLLHLCVDYDEIEIAEWLLDRGADPNTPADLDDDGFGGHTALFGCVVSQPFRVGRRRDDAFARLLLDRGADVDAQASLRKQLRFVEDETLHEYRDVTPVSWGEQFHDQDWVSQPVLKLLRSAGG